MPIDIATGDVELAREDFALPGRVPLKWTRHFKTALLTSTAPLAPGWTVSLFSSLKRVGTDWHFTTGEGDLHVFADPDGRVIKGHTIRLLGAYHEMERVDNRLVITQWDVDSGEIQRFVFTAKRVSGVLDLVGIEDVSGDGLELTWDKSGRMTHLHQRIEKRTVVVNYSTAGRINSLALVTEGGVETQLVSYEYDQAGRLSAAFDRRGLANRYEYDAQSRITRELLKDGAVYSYKYDEKGRCIRFSGLDHYNEKRLQFFDATHSTIVTNSYGKSSIFQYLPSGQISSESNPSGNKQSTIFDEYNRIVARVDATGASTRYTFDVHGNRDSVTDSLGNAYRLAFNAHHQPISVTNPLGQTWRREYDAKHRLVATQNPLGESWKLEYDETGNPVAISDPLGSTRRQQFADGLLRERTDWMGHITRFGWDELGQVTERIGPLGERTAFHYDLVGNPVAVELPDGGCLRATYDSGDNLTSFHNAKGHTTLLRYGACRRLLERVDPVGRTVRYGWGTEPDRLDVVSNQKGEMFTYFRDAQGRIMRERSFDGREQNFEYDGAGRCIATTNGNDERIQLKRDAAGKIIELVLPDNAITSFEYDSAERITSAVNPDICTRFEYDNAGRLVREMQGENWIRTEYNAAGEVIRTQTSMGHEIRYDLDSNGGVSRLITGNGCVLAFERDANGRETSRKLPGGIRLDQRFDSTGRLLEQWVGQLLPSAPLDSSSREFHLRRGFDIIKRDYQYDSDGLLLSVQDGRWGTTDYVYDPVERLLTAFREKGLSETFEYDATDNVTRIQRPNSDPDDDLSTYGPGNRLLQRGNTRYEYDADGRLARKIEFASTNEPKVWRYEWNARGQLQGLFRPDGTRWEYKYDAFGRRVSKIGPDTSSEFLWDRDTIIQEIPYAGKAAAWIFKRNSFTPLAKVQNGALYPIITDHLGTPREMLDISGKLIWTASFSAWGLTDKIHKSEEHCPIRFQGQWFDEESGLHYNRFRYYDPSSNRYLSVDPVGISGGWNVYQYTPNPINWVDPFGLSSLFRGMTKDTDGGPVVFSGPAVPGSNAANSLGTRPAEGGMSTALDPMAIQPHRRPEDFGGTQKNAAMFKIDSDKLAAHGLQHTNDHDSHVSITTAPGVDPKELDERLAKSKGDWEEVKPGCTDK